MEAIISAATSDSPPARVPNPDAWQAALDAHGLWDRTSGRDGRRLEASGLDLSDFDLRGASLRRADLRGARLSRANLNSVDLSDASLDDADLAGADLRGADLSGASLRNAHLRRASFRDARLADADLTGASGLLASQLGGADLSGAKLPADLSGFDALANVAEVSKSCQNLLTSLFFVCAYTWLTIVSTADAQLVNNSGTASSKLPILGIDIPLVRFYMVAPVLLLCLYAYFQIGLQRLWEELADLPAAFPDGRPLDKKAYPWLLNALIRRHLPRLGRGRSHVRRWQARFAVTLAWGLVPLTIGMAWARYLRAHDWSVTWLHIGLLSASAGLGVASLRLASSTLRGSERQSFRWRRAWRDARALGLGVALASVAAFYLVSLGAIEGVNPASVYDEDLARRLVARYRPYDVRRWLPLGLNHLGLSPSAVLYDANLSTKPANWNPTNESLLETVHGADLEHRNLRHAMGFNAFGVNAYLQDADLRWADLREADLRRADFRRSLLHGTNFRFAQLDRADFRKADLTAARLKDADAPGALFEDADLRGACLANADLHGANFKATDLREADLSGARFTLPDDPKTFDRKPATLAGARLDGANLANANLSGADLSNASLRGANLSGADLTGANLKDATGLTAEQWASAKIDARTRPPASLRAPGHREPAAR